MTSKHRFCVPVLALLALLLTISAQATSYTLTTVIQGSGSIGKNPNNATYPSGVNVTLTATPNNGWYFGGWSGDVTAVTNPVNVTMTGNLTVTGLFLAYPLYSLTLTTNGQGAIVLNPLAATYTSNSVVTATALRPAAGSSPAGRGALTARRTPFP